MKAAQINTYGSYDAVEINHNTERTSVKDEQILVEVHAASINPFDGKIRKGYLKENIPLQFPVTLGGDYSGIVIEVGKEVLDFKKGDEVYGTALIVSGGSGAFAEYAAADSSHSALKPISTNFEVAAALPLVGSSAVQALEDHIDIQSGQKILIHGGAGGIGHIAIQVAKARGAYVATTIGTDDIEYAKQLGADIAIDYKNEKFEEKLKEFDAVFDTVGGETLNKSFEVLKKGGILVSMLGQPDPKRAEEFGITAIGQGTHTNTKHLTRVKELIDERKIKTHIDKVFPLDKIKEAFKYQEEGHPRGKVVIAVKSY